MIDTTNRYMGQIMAECDCQHLGCETRGYCMADRTKELEAELHLMKTSGIVEVAVRNPSVMEYMKHWEGRAEKAEAKLAEAVRALSGVVKHMPDHPDTVWIDARTTLAELKGENDA